MKRNDTDRPAIPQRRLKYHPTVRLMVGDGCWIIPTSTKYSPTLLYFSKTSPYLQVVLRNDHPEPVVDF